MPPRHEFYSKRPVQSLQRQTTRPATKTPKESVLRQALMQRMVDDSKRSALQRSGADSNQNTAPIFNQSLDHFLSYIQTARESAGARQANSNNLLQRTIEKIPVISYFDEEIPIKQLVVSGKDDKELKRMRNEIDMFIEEVEWRYTKGKAPLPLLSHVIDELNASGVITYQRIRDEITKAEKAQSLPVTEPQVAAHDNPTGSFFHLLEMRRGAYNWEAGTSRTFSSWIQATDTASIPVDATINCWEAVFVSAIDAGLLTKKEIIEVYNQENRSNAVYHFIGRKGIHVIEHKRDPATKNILNETTNQIQPGNLIIIEGSASPLHHVVVAVGSNPEDYSQVPVMSLDGAIGGGGLVKTKLVELIDLNKELATIKYGSL